LAAMCLIFLAIDFHLQLQCLEGRRDRNTSGGIDNSAGQYY